MALSSAVRKGKIVQPGFYLPSMVWGLAGAFIYAGPNLLLCIQKCRAEGCPITDCIMEFVVAMVIGGLAAEISAPYLSAFLRQTEPHQVRAIAGVVGLVANRAAPGLINILSARPMLQAILKSLGGTK